MLALVQENTTNTDMTPIFTSTQNKGVFVVLLFGVFTKRKTLFVKITFSLFFCGSYLPLITRSRREMCWLRCRSGASS